MEPDLKMRDSSEGRDTEALIETLRPLKVPVFHMYKLRFFLATQPVARIESRKNAHFFIRCWGLQ